MKVCVIIIMMVLSLPQHMFRVVAPLLCLQVATHLDTIKYWIL